MPVITKVHHRRLSRELNARISYLLDAFESRELLNSGEGARGSWTRPENMCATTRSALEVRLAVDDFKSILAEIRKMK